MFNPGFPALSISIPRAGLLPNDSMVVCHHQVRADRARVKTVLRCDTPRSRSLMADYYPLISKAIAGLEKNTGEQRRRLYEHARTTLLRQLSKMDPPRTVSEAVSERRALEDAIGKAEAEAEAARQLRNETSEQQT